MAGTRFLTRSRHRTSVGLLLALALVCAQTGALVHGASHLRSRGESLSAPAHASTVCSDCVAFAPLLAAVSGRGHALPLAARIVTAYRTLVAPLSGLSPRHSFLSRGPPGLT